MVDLKEKMRELIKAERDYYYKYISSQDLNSDKEKNVPPMVMDEYKRLKHRKERFGDECASHPELFDVLTPWMVDVVGKGSCSEELKKETICSMNFENGISKQGNLADIIQRFVKDNNFKITDRSFSCDSWQIGIPCNEFESRRLCTLLHHRFKKAIEVGLIKIQRHFWHWRFSDLYNWNDIE